MMRGTFANVRIKNLMLGGKEGGNDGGLTGSGREMSDLRRGHEAYRPTVPR
jgi:aconitate hydratase